MIYEGISEEVIKEILTSANGDLTKAGDELATLAGSLDV